MSLVNYLGTYETLDQVWETYPEGGKEGDYLYIASVLKKWNKYTSAWVDATQEDVEGSTIMSLEEDVVVGSSTLINYLGRFETLENAINTYPEGGNEGDYIYVGDDIYAWDKYANGWFVSSDTPLEFAISEEDIILYSNTFINYLGGFVDRDAVWQKYPEGGKVGDYLYIASDLHIWDKYICNWVAATPPDESSQIRPIEHLSQEGVVEYSENYINYLGVFESIEQAWETYPEGGKEGDYIIVDGEQLRWNKYTNNWGEYDPDASTPARPVATIYGDLHVHNDVIIGEDLYARILETFTTKKWVLEQGYISLDDVTSELVMSKIVPDNTTIEVRDGKLVVIGGGGGGTADSVEWDNITGKPEWIGDTKPTYTLDEIAGSNGDGFVTLLSDQAIEGVKNFANGAKFNGALLSYDEEKKAWVFPGNIIASGGITAFGSLSTPVVSLFEALPIDGTTIKRDPITNELYVDTNVVGGSGGGSLDEEQLEEFLRPYATIEYVSNNYTTKTSVDKALSDKANKATTLAGYGIADAYTKSHIDSNFVAIGTKQEITGEKDFVGGLKVNGGLVEYNATLKAWVLNGDLLVTGGVSAFSNISGFKPSTITDAVLIDDRTIKRNADGLLYAVAQGTGGINKGQLADYLTTNGYATQSWVLSQKYLTGISSSMVTNALGYTPLSDTGTAASAYLLKAIIGSSLVANTWDSSNGLSVSGWNTDGGWNTKYGTSLNISGFNTWHHRLGFNTNGVIEHWAAINTTTMSKVGDIAYVANIPTKLSQLTDDVFSGKVLALEIAKIGYGKANSWPLELFSTNSYTGIAFTCSDGTAHLRFMGGSKWGVTSAGWTATYDLLHSGNYSEYAVKKNVFINTAIADNEYGYGYVDGGWPEAGSAMVFGTENYKAGIQVGALGSAIRYGYTAGTTSFTWRTILDDNNYSDYALPLTGGKINGDLEVAGCLYSSGENLRIRPRGASLAGVEIALSDDDYWQISHRGSFANNELHFYHNANGTWSNSVLSLISDGSVIVGNNLLAKGGVTATNSSDERLKRNIRKFNAREVLMSLGGVWEYEYIDSEVQKNHIYEGTHYGLIYQNVKGTTLDVMCHEREDGMGALNYIHPKFISLIAGATMENISEVEKLKRKIRHLENKVKQLEQRA